MPQPYKLFTIYAREDEQYLKELLGQLRPLELAGRIKVWSDREINPGVEWEKAIVQKLDTADIILILVSSAYYSSVYIHDVEIKYAISRHEQGEARVLPVIVRPCSFLDDPIISKLQVLPTDGNAVTDRRHWHERDDAWLDVVAGVKRTLDLLLAAELEKEKSAREAALAIEQAAEQQRLAALAAKQEAERQKKEAKEAAERQKEEAKQAKLAEQQSLKQAEAERLASEHRTRAEQARIEQEAEDLLKRQTPIRRGQEDRDRLEQQRRELENATRRADQRAWQQTLKVNDLNAYQSYLAQNPQGEHAREARFRIKELKRAAATPLPVGRYAAYGGGVLALALAIWLVPKMFGGEKEAFSYLMVPVTSGTFTMGSPESEKNRGSDECRHSVTVGSFSIGKYEVTQAQWEAIMGNNPSFHKDSNDFPVEEVSWDDVQKFIQKLNKDTGKRYRLPTEVEWEFAARGGNKSGKYLYAGSNNLDSVAWYSENTENKPHSVGRKAPNELGLYDMSGNVWEWCQDTYQPYLCDNKTKTTGATRVYRGGSWIYSAQFCRTSNRSYNATFNSYGGIGFRLVLSALSDSQ